MLGVGRKWGAGRSVGVHVCSCKNRSAATNIHFISAALYGLQSFFSVKHNFLGTKAACRFRSCKTYSSKFPVSDLLICSVIFVAVTVGGSFAAATFILLLRNYCQSFLQMDKKMCHCNSLLRQLTPLTVGM